MENIRPKIASLGEKELAQLLINSFFITGKDVKLQAEQTKLFLGEVFKKQGGQYIDDFCDAFSRYAAFELPGAENLQPTVSPRFINTLMNMYEKFKKTNRQGEKNCTTYFFTTDTGRKIRSVYPVYSC